MSDQSLKESIKAAMKAANMAPTMAVDGRYLYYSEGFVDKMTVDQLIGMRSAGKGSMLQ